MMVTKETGEMRTLRANIRAVVVSRTWVRRMKVRAIETKQDRTYELSWKYEYTSGEG